MSIPLIYQNIESKNSSCSIAAHDIYYPTSVKEIIKTEQIWIDDEEGEYRSRYQSKII